MSIHRDEHPLLFRRASFEDVADIVRLVESAYRGEESRAGWTTEADLLDGRRTDAEQVRGLIAGEPNEGCIVLGFAADALVATVHLSRELDALHVGMVAVRPGLQGRGHGAALLREAERIAREEEHVVRLRMHVIRQRHELIAWYERQGFRRTGARAPFPYGQPRFGLPRRPDLEFEVLEKLT